MKNKTRLFADVAPAVPLGANSKQVYTYTLLAKNNDTLHPHALVTIPFGKRNIAGTVMAIHNKPAPYPTKAIFRVVPIELTGQQVIFARWIARTHQGGLGFTLRLFYPPARLPPTGHHRTRVSVITQDSIQTTTGAALVEPDIRKRSQAMAATIAAAVQKGQQILILVPEKWMIDRLAKLFPDWLVQCTTLVHAELKPRQLAAAWAAVRSGEARVVIGTQKALFLPYQRLGLIVIEEEQLPTHKLWDQYPRLHNIYAAEQLALIHQARMVYATSFPSLRLRHLVASGQLTPVAGTQHPLRTEVVTFTFAERQRRAPLPEAFVPTLQKWVKQNERILLFYNRRGSWQALICRGCQATVHCPQCGVSTVVHTTGTGKRKKWYIACHHCAWRSELPQRCPNCRRSGLVPVGIGTEKLATVLARLLGRAVIRLDADTRTRLPASQLSARLAAEKQGTVVIGTAAIFTALPGMTFDRIVWLFPERSLLYPDVRSEERAMIVLARLYQLYPPAIRGSIMLVTRQPHLIERTLALPLAAFTERQLKERKRFGYPPFSDMIRLTASAKSSQQALNKARILRHQIEERLEKTHHTNITIRGPFQSFIKRRRGQAEAHLILLGQLPTLVALYEGLPADYVDLAPERIL